ncbi:U3-containing 90S pre-ribosomal complex subunit-domain containing protein [Phyllosticta citrichinensis]|uniref:U3-containing 90S pre-ribosomal complex subunit-domain containing protein n=1 Tax=Phyllosticta citrichinensis TaxID=1130410 RepID=A0ABR1XIZ0_9PEZI
MSDSEDGAGVPLIEPMPGSPADGKRKRGEEEPKQSKRAKRRKNKQPKDVHDEDLDEAAGLNRSIGRMDSRLLADYMAQRTKRFEPDLSLVELEDRYVPENSICDTSSWGGERTLDQLPAFVEKFAQGDLTKAPKSNGAPHTIVVAASGIRAADVTRGLRKFEEKGTKVAKLFAKHIKLKEAIESCKRLKMNFGVGTPQRISDLLGDGALSTSNLKRIIIDASHIDVKKRGIMDMKETQVPLAQLLGRQELKSRFGQPGGIEVVFY